MMLLVAGISASLAAFRIHFSLGSFVTAVACLGFYRGFARIDRHRAIVGPLTNAAVLWILCESIFVGSAITGISAAIAVPACFILSIPLIAINHRAPLPSLLDVFAGGIVGARIASWMRRWLWAGKAIRIPESPIAEATGAEEQSTK